MRGGGVHNWIHQHEMSLKHEQYDVLGATTLLWITLNSAIAYVAVSQNIATITSQESALDEDIQTVYTLNTSYGTTTILHAVSVTNKEKILFTTHLPIASLPPDAPLPFIEKHILPKFVRSTYEKTNRFRFTCQNEFFPGAITLMMLNSVTKTEACPDAVRDAFALLQQQPQLREQWEHWAAAPYEKVLGLIDVPLMFG